MPGQFLHGVEVVELDGGPRPIRTVKSSVIGLVGTAPDADATLFPLNTPVLIAGRRSEAAPLGTSGSIPSAIDGIFDQAGAMVVVIRVETDDDPNQQLAHVLGGVNTDTGDYEGLQALLAAESLLGVAPRILIVPGFSEQQAVVSELMGIAERLRAVIIADGPSTNDAAAIAYRQNFGSARVYIVDPKARVFDVATASEKVEPMSPRVAGLISRSDNDRGFWWSPSNLEIYGIIGTERAVDFTLGDTNARANYLNENEVATVIQKTGFRLWGNRTCSSDPKWAFLSVRRTADMINESLLRAHLWAVDRNITKTYLEDVTEGVNAYLRDLKAIGAIIGGECWADPALNTPSNISQGKVFFDFDFTPPFPAEHVTFRSSLVNDYLEEIV
ncbi:phage tail sheath subtilisin-like domain-containing protein [Grimontia kaedaensis]|uniref:Phage tail sheath subtilisin-like domain-containing protein n=1 Tax=Grimontia kaedaensis TaxID=2872157 RepID=A0ABY4WVI3_9GAMM|nr:phage tail sheath subtilisin-like domain-containing protein [Grimontia kaedaensis]USH01057.1 phage tail sheath subtilisin-like domain-containing protein [Grimontia kaedaensis]